MIDIRTRTRLICLHAPPVSDEWIGYTEYLSGLLDAERVYRETEGTEACADLEAGENSLIVLHESPSPWWRRLLGLTPSCRLASRGPTSLLITRQPRWPLSRILLILRVEAADEAAVTWACTLARAAGAAITVLPILPPIPILYTTNAGGVYDLQMLLATDTPAATRLRRLSAQLESWQIPATISPGQGEPSRQMRQEIAHGNYDLVIVGAEPASRLYRCLVADLVGPLLDCANCSLLIARGINNVFVTSL